MAPELLYPTKFGLRTCRVTKQADIYAFGIVVYEVLTGRPPFGERRQHEIMVLAVEGKRPRKPENAGSIGFGRGTWELVQQCWDQEREERPTVEQVSEHFQKVAANSSIVPPGPTTPAYSEAEAPTASISVGASESFSQCFLQLMYLRPNSSHTKFTGRLFLQSQRGTSILQQTRLTVGLMSSGGVRPSFPAPSAQLTPVRPSFFRRVGTRIMDRNPASRIDAPESPSAQT